jgi:hypothetical protein
MARKGNNGNHGKKGRSGRKSAFQEKADAARLIDLITRKYTRDELKDMAMKTDIPMDLLERMVLYAHMGKEKTAIALFNKALPDHVFVHDPDLPFGELD